MGNEKIENVGYVVREYFYTNIEDPILEDGIHLNATDKAVYSCLKSFTNKKNKVAFPSQKTLSLMLNGMDKKTIKKSMDWLEHLNIISIEKRKSESGDWDSNLYIFHPIPEMIIEASRLFDAKNWKEIEIQIKEWKTIRKEFESKEKTHVEKENEKKEEKVKGNEKESENKVSSRIESEMIVSVFKKKRGKYQLKVNDVSKLTEYINKEEDGLKAMNTLETVLEQFEGEVVVNSIKKASKSEIRLNTEEFKGILLEYFEQKEKKNSYFAKKNYENQKSYKQDSIVIPSTVSDYSEDEYGDLFNELKKQNA